MGQDDGCFNFVTVLTTGAGPSLESDAAFCLELLLSYGGRMLRHKKFPGIPRLAMLNCLKAFPDLWHPSHLVLCSVSGRCRTCGLCARLFSEIAAMNRILLSVALFALSIGPVLAQDYVYEAKRTSSAPTIDGFLTGTSEWADASTTGTDWSLVKSGTLDQAHNRFQMMWDDAGLYILHQVDAGEWQAGRGLGDIEFDYWYLNLFFDPNTDGESNDQTAPTDTGVDGYQFAFNQPLGQSSYAQDKPDLGLFQEAHVNAIFGNQGWDSARQTDRFFTGAHVEQTMSSDEVFGFTEIFLPWANFNAADPEYYSHLGDSGLYHPQAPADGDEWYFNMARQRFNSAESAAWLPPSGFFGGTGSRPHGLLRFVNGDVVFACDINLDGVCSAIDIDTMAAAIANGDLDLRLDLSGDGMVDSVDKDFLIEDPTMFFTYYGDSNLDGEFNSSDFVAVFTTGEYEDEIAGNSSWETGDWTGDAEFDSGDFVQAFQAGGYEGGARVAAVAIPEPSSCVLFFLGVLILGLRRKFAGDLGQ